MAESFRSPAFRVAGKEKPPPVRAGVSVEWEGLVGEGSVEQVSNYRVGVQVNACKCLHLKLRERLVAISGDW